MGQGEVEMSTFKTLENIAKKDVFAPKSKWFHNNSHSSHSAHSSHGNHSNDASSGNPSWSGKRSADHSLTFAQVSNSLSASRAGIKGGTGSLTELKNYANTARATYASPAAQFTYDAVKVNESNLNALLKSSGGTTKSMYPNGTVKSTATLVINGTSYNGAQDTATDNESSASAFSKTATGSSPVTSYSLHASSSAPAKCTATKYEPTMSPTKGNKITSSDVSNILSKIKKVTTDAMGNYGTYLFSGTRTITHTNHNNHSSHTAHSNHTDSRLEYKENVAPIAFKALDILSKVKTVQFNYKEDAVANGHGDNPNIKHYGFIADNAPKEVATEYHDRMDMMNCIGLLIKAVQELNDRIKVIEHNMKV